MNPAAQPSTDTADSTPQLSAWEVMFKDATNAELKLAMAASGTILSLFTAGHMAGNMQVYLGPKHYNDYAEFLRTVGAPVLPRNSVLWVVRIGLLASATSHIMAGTELTLRAMRAERHTVQSTVQDLKLQLTGKQRRRPRGRRRSVPQIIARSMRSTGVVLGLFTAYHVADLTVGARPAASSKHRHGDAYGNLVASLSRPSVAFFYTASMAALAGHMIHGVRTAAMDAGFTTTQQRAQLIEAVAKLAGATVALGNVTIPVAVQAKVVR